MQFKVQILNLTIPLGKASVTGAFSLDGDPTQSKLARRGLVRVFLTLQES
jgi:hypothetical protein